jgi:hypothetical protein
VTIRVVAKEGDKSSSELKVLRFLSTEKALAHPQNIALPILEEFACDGWTFVSMPSLGYQMDSPGFFNLAEVLDAMEQIVGVGVPFAMLTRRPLTVLTQGLVYLHDNLIAHRVGPPVFHRARAPSDTCTRISPLITSSPTGSETTNQERRSDSLPIVLFSRGSATLSTLSMPFSFHPRPLPKRSPWRRNRSTGTTGGSPLPRLRALRIIIRFRRMFIKRETLFGNRSACVRLPLYLLQL